MLPGRSNRVSGTLQSGFRIQLCWGDNAKASTVVYEYIGPHYKMKNDDGNQYFPKVPPGLGWALG